MAYSYQQIEDLWVQYGGNPAQAAMAASIAMAESGGDPNATNVANSNGTVDRGLFQINSVHGGQSSYDLATNIQAAINISSNGSNWQPWSTYNNGAYQNHYNPGITPSGSSVAQQGGSVAQQTDAAGVSLQNSPVGSFTAATPALSIDALRSQSPLVAALVQSIPELQQIFQQAVAESWTPDKFTAAVQNSAWWSQHSDSARTALAQMKSDPATWNQNVTNLQSRLQALSAQYGSTASAAQIYNIAVDALTNGYDANDSVLRQKFEQFIVPVSGNHFGGEAGNNEAAIRQAQMDLGVFLPEQTLDNNIQQIGGGKMSVNDVTANLRSMAAGMYPAYAQQINQGMSVSDIAAPYTSRAQQLLEGGSGMINIQSPLIKKALQHIDPKTGQPTPMPLGDFETAVRKDPRWLNTDNAQNDMMSQAHQVLQNFGFAY